MKLNELLREYRDALPPSAMPSFDQLMKESRNRRIRKVVYAGIGIAALVFFGAILWKPAKVTPRELVEVVRTSEIPSQVEVVAPVVTVTRPAPRKRLVRKSSAYDLRGFVAIAENSMLPNPRLFQVVRVNVSRDRLAALGVMSEGGDERMMADVLVGDDGMTRAVKVIDRAER